MAESAGGLYLQVKLDTAAADKQLTDLGAKFGALMRPRGTSEGSLGAESRVMANALTSANKSMTSMVNASRTVALNMTRTAASARILEKSMESSLNAAEAFAKAMAAAADARKGIRALPRVTTQGLGPQAPVPGFFTTPPKKPVATPGLGGGGSPAKDTEEAVRQFNALRVGANLAGESVRGVTGAVAGLRGGGAFGMYIAMKNTAALAESAKTALAGVGTAGTVAAIGVAAIGVAALGAAAGVGALSYKIVNMGTQSAVGLETLQAGMTGLMGSTKGASQEMEYLLNLGKKSIVPTEQIIQADITLQQYGIHWTELRQAMVKGITNIGAIPGFGAQATQDMAVALGQVVAMGKLLGQERNQLANAGVNLNEVYGKIADQTGQSLGKIRALALSGGIDAQTFIAGFLSYANDLQSVADMSAKTISGMIANIKDSITIGLGQAFQSAGVTDALRPFLMKIGSFFSGGTFAAMLAPIAAATTRLFATIAQSFNAVSSSGAGSLLVALFTVVIPNAIDFAARSFRFFSAVMSFIIPVAVGVWNAIFALIKSLAFLGNVAAVVGGVLVAAFAAPVVVVGFLTAAVLTLAAAIAVTSGSISSLAHLVRGDFGGAATALTQGFRNADVYMNQAVTVVHGMATGLKQATDAARNFGKALPKSGIKLPGIETGRAGGPQDLGGGAADKGGGAGKKGGGGGAAGGATQQAALLWDETRRWIHTASQLEEAIFGVGSAFSATSEQIINQGRALAKALTEGLPASAARSGIINTVEVQIKALAKLADQRDAIAKRLEDSRRKLEDAISARTSFAADTAKGLKDFVNSLSAATGAAQKLEYFDNAGTYIFSGGGATDFAASMAKRLATVRKFVTDIRTLQKRGLAGGVTQQLVAAGPEQGGAAASQLAASSDETIANVNAMQSEINDLSKSFSTEQASIYFDSGVKSAQAIVSGLVSQQTVVTAKAKLLTNAIYTEMVALARPASTAGVSAGNAFGSGVGAGVSKGIGGKIPAMNASMASMMNSMRAGMLSGFSPQAADRQTDPWWARIKSKFAGWGRDIYSAVAHFGEIVSRFNIWKPIQDSIPGYSQIRSKLGGISDAFHWLARTIQGWWNHLNLSINVPGWVQGIAHGLFRIVVPGAMFAEGGLVTKPTLAIIGEAGPELVLPLSKVGNQTNNGLPDMAGGGTYVSVYIGNEALDPYIERVTVQRETDVASAVLAGRRV